MKEPLSIPYNMESEQALIGAIIEDPEILPEISTILKPVSFYKAGHQHIFRACLELADLQNPIDEVTIGDKLHAMNCLDECGGYAYLSELVECVPSVGNVVYYARLIQEDALLRDVITLTTEIGRRARDPEQNVAELLGDAQQKLIELSNQKSRRATSHIKEVFAELFQEWEKKTEDPDSMPGIQTDFQELDRFTGGLIPPALWIIAARPKMGKTAFAMNIVENVNLKSDIKGATLIFSLEMSKKQIANRMLTSNSKVDNKKIKFGNLENEDWNKLAASVDRLSPEPIYINKTAKTINEIRTEARLLNLEHPDGLGLIVVDYLQLMFGSKKTSSREQEIAEISRGLKALAMEFNIPVIALSQLNRELEKRGNKRPVLSDLRESGSIEQDADIILFIYRDEVYNEDSPDRGVAEIIIGGHREGPTGTVRLGFVGKYTKFISLGNRQ